jgi:hypothetical protein
MEEVKMRRHESSTLQPQEDKNITTINNEREIGEDGNSGQVTLQN